MASNTTMLTALEALISMMSRPAHDSTKRTMALEALSALLALEKLQYHELTSKQEAAPCQSGPLDLVLSFLNSILGDAARGKKNEVVLTEPQKIFAGIDECIGLMRLEEDILSKEAIAKIASFAAAASLGVAGSGLVPPHATAGLLAFALFAAGVSKLIHVYWIDRPSDFANIVQSTSLDFYQLHEMLWIELVRFPSQEDDIVVVFEEDLAFDENRLVCQDEQVFFGWQHGSVE